MEAGTKPPNWENLVKYSTKMATSQDVYLSDTWLQGQSNKGESYPLSYPFDIVTDHHKCQNRNTSGSASDNKKIPISVSEGDRSHKAISPNSQHKNQSADNSLTNYQSKFNNIRDGVKIDTHNSNPYSDP